MSTYTFVTSSDDKFREARRILDLELRREAVDLAEIQSLSVDEVARDKALRAYEILGQKPVLVEDSGLAIEAWRGLPGPLIRWFEQALGLNGICAMLDGCNTRAAVARTVVAVCDGDVQLFSGDVRGSIAPTPRGENGFGWDRIFIPQGLDKTFAEMSSSEKDDLSMRRKALLSFRAAQRANVDE